MRLREHQCKFTEDCALLILYARRLGHEVAYGPENATHKPAGQHPKKLAKDFDLFIDGEYQTTTKAHQPLGEHWESLDPLNRWGGRYQDGNHYERMEEPWR